MNLSAPRPILHLVWPICCLLATSTLLPAGARKSRTACDGNLRLN